MSKRSSIIDLRKHVKAVRRNAGTDTGKRLLDLPKSPAFNYAGNAHTLAVHAIDELQDALRGLTSLVPPYDEIRILDDGGRVVIFFDNSADGAEWDDRIEAARVKAEALLAKYGVKGAAR